MNWSQHWYLYTHGQLVQIFHKVHQTKVPSWVTILWYQDDHTSLRNQVWMLLWCLELYPYIIHIHSTSHLGDTNSCALHLDIHLWNTKSLQIHSTHSSSCPDHSGISLSVWCAFRFGCGHSLDHLQLVPRPIFGPIDQLADIEQALFVGHVFHYSYWSWWIYFGIQIVSFSLCWCHGLCRGNSKVLQPWKETPISCDGHSMMYVDMCGSHLEDGLTLKVNGWTWLELLISLVTKWSDRKQSKEYLAWNLTHEATSRIRDEGWWWWWGVKGKGEKREERRMLMIVFIGMCLHK